jgi:hypothetical protein
MIPRLFSYALRLVILCVILAMAGCSPLEQQIGDSQLSASEINELFEQPSPYPEVVNFVSPEPGSITGEQNISIEIRGRPLLEPWDEVEVYANHQLFPDSGYLPRTEPVVVIATLECVIDAIGIKGCGAGANQFQWTSVLSPGMHYAEFRIRSTSGQKEFTYIWAFEID